MFLPLQSTDLTRVLYSITQTFTRFLQHVLNARFDQYNKSGKVDEFGERVPTVCMPGEVAIPVKVIVIAFALTQLCFTKRKQDADAISDAFEFEEVCDRIEKYTRR